ncbi:response regulator [Anditalea andensis]|uniref:Transcriptional regulator n=1 Tax=Anditalea andensis TaxID=1048983 RepID=A0A074L3X8_9BACT|nr:response regulator [Anditalea andensis]KEO74553.1 transcriptional regulator [Anditalea andensis]
MYSFDSIVLIDDDPINNLINKRLISKLDICHKVDEFLEAEKALCTIQAMGKNGHLLILLDINMPVMNGWDFLNQYLKVCDVRKDKIIVLSSSIDFQDRQKAEEFNCVSGFIEKPLTPDKLKKVL